MSQPVIITIHAAVNGRMSATLASVEIENPQDAPASLAMALRELADVIEDEPELFDESLAVTP
jgi:hypothetical protein